MEKISSWNQSSYLGPGKIKKMIKQMKKSYKKADELAKKSEEEKINEEKEAESYIERELENLDK